MLAQVKYIGTLAAAASTQVVVKVPSGSRALELHLAQVGAVSAPVTASFEVSADGVTYVASKMGAISATAVSDGSTLVRQNDSPYRLDGGVVSKVRVTITNGSATSASVVLLAEDQVNLGV